MDERWANIYDDYYTNHLSFSEISEKYKLKCDYETFGNNLYYEKRKRYYAKKYPSQAKKEKEFNAIAKKCAELHMTYGQYQALETMRLVSAT